MNSFYKGVELVEERKYPYIGIASDGECVLFREEECGTVIVCGGGYDELGYYSDTWEETLFTPLTKGEIIIQLP